MKIGISYVDVDGAKKNYMAEVADKDFERIKDEAHNSWNEALGKIKVEGGTNEDRVVFYTCMYHAMIDPRIHQDVDGRYVGGDQKIYTSDNSFTKRTVFSMGRVPQPVSITDDYQSYSCLRHDQLSHHNGRAERTPLL